MKNKNVNVTVLPFGVWGFFSFMYFLTESNVLPLGKWEYVWRFFAGPINFLIN